MWIAALAFAMVRSGLFPFVKDTFVRSNASYAKMIADRLYDKSWFRMKHPKIANKEISAEMIFSFSGMVLRDTTILDQEYRYPIRAPAIWALDGLSPNYLRTQKRRNCY
jgi:hypothetical protein